MKMNSGLIYFRMSLLNKLFFYAGRMRKMHNNFIDAFLPVLIAAVRVSCCCFWLKLLMKGGINNLNFLHLNSSVCNFSILCCLYC